MAMIGKFIGQNHPAQQYVQVRDKFGNQWNVAKTEVDRTPKEGEEVAFRLDFSDPSKRLPKLLLED